jgi:hypothetical protein
VLAGYVVNTKWAVSGENVRTSPVRSGARVEIFKLRVGIVITSRKLGANVCSEWVLVLGTT